MTRLKLCGWTFFKCKPTIVGTCYRPPDQYKFYELLEETCSNFTDFGESEVIVIGDFNTNMFKKGHVIFKALKNLTNIFC